VQIIKIFNKKLKKVTKDILVWCCFQRVCKQCILLLFLLQGDRTFTFEMNSPPASYFLKTAAGIEKGAQKPGREVAGMVTLKQIYEIAKIKKEDSTCKNVPLQSICRSIIGSARSMGIEVVSGRDADT